MIFTVIGLLGLYFIPVFSTPLFQVYSGDYLIFKIIGSGWTEGHIPYKDLFDSKGPLLFLIQVLGFTIQSGKWGIWILEVVFAVLSFELIFQCGVKLGVKATYNYFCTAISILFYFACLENGNTVEEFCLPFQLLPLYLTISYFNGSNKRIYLSGFITGLCFGAVALIRLNNNCVIVGLAIGLICWFVKENRLKDLFRIILCFAAGLIVIFIPFCIYFALHSALSDMMYATFGLNYYYLINGSNIDSTRPIIHLICFTPSLVLFLIAFLNRKKINSGTGICCIFIGLVTFFTFIFGRHYTHYIQMATPSVALSLFLSYSVSKRQKKVILYVMGVILLVMECLCLINWKSWNKWVSHVEHHKFKQIGTQYILETIPPREQDSIYSYGIPFVVGSIYETGHYPCGRFFFLQDMYSDFDPKMRNLIREDFVKSAPKWVICTPEAGKTLHEELKEYILVENNQSSLPEDWKVYKRNN